MELQFESWPVERKRYASSVVSKALPDTHIENVLVTVTAASGATSNAAWASISLAQLYYGTKIPAAACIFFMWAIVYLGYAMAALARQFLLYDPIYV